MTSPRRCSRSSSTRTLLSRPRPGDAVREGGLGRPRRASPKFARQYDNFMFPWPIHVYPPGPWRRFPARSAARACCGRLRPCKWVRATEHAGVRSVSSSVAASRRSSSVAPGLESVMRNPPHLQRESITRRECVAPREFCAAVTLLRRSRKEGPSPQLLAAMMRPKSSPAPQALRARARRRRPAHAHPRTRPLLVLMEGLGADEHVWPFVSSAHARTASAVHAPPRE